MTTASQIDNAGRADRRRPAATRPRWTSAPAMSSRPSAFDPGLVYDCELRRVGPVRLRHRPVPAGTSHACLRLVGSIDPSDLNYAVDRDRRPGRAARRSPARSRTSRRRTRASTTSRSRRRPGPRWSSARRASWCRRRHPSPSRSGSPGPPPPSAHGPSARSSWVEKKGGKNSPHNHSVRSNIAVRPVALAVPIEIGVCGTSGSGRPVDPARAIRERSTPSRTGWSRTTSRPWGLP